MKKRVISLLVVVALLGCMISSTAATVIDTLDKSIGEEEYLFDPKSGQYLRVRNVEAEIRAITQESERDCQFEEMFEQSRLSRMRDTNNVSNFDSEINDQIPGGVGYGAFFTNEFGKDFTTGTEIYYDIICPSTVGGDVDDFLYLTSTNRAGKCVEAFISYNKQEHPKFKVYDWAKPEANRWVVDISYDNLTSYLSHVIIMGLSWPCVSVRNQTVQVSATQWKNVVYLLNYQENTFDQIYSYTYSSTLQEQVSWPFWNNEPWGPWGPIVETFQEEYNQSTNIIGFANTQLRSKNTSYSSNNWAGWGLLTDAQSDIKNQNLGFSVIYSQPNYTFLVS